jgi:ABC-type multidrug transport system fused ATPase/permease subunit
MTASDLGNLGLSISGKLTHMSSLAIAFFILAFLSGYTNQQFMALILFFLGIIAFVVYMFFARKAYLEDIAAKNKASQKTSLSKMELLEITMKAKDKYDHTELDAIYAWLKKAD